MIELTDRMLDRLVREAILEDTYKKKAREILLDQVKDTAESYMASWKREDGPKFQISIEVDPDLVEYVFSSDRRLESER